MIAAEPGASGAQMVKLALETGGPIPSPAGAPAKARELPAATDLPPEICALVFADRLATSAGAEVARGWLVETERTPMALLDPLAGPLAVDLATRGVLSAESLPEDLRASFQRARASE